MKQPVSYFKINIRIVYKAFFLYFSNSSYQRILQLHIYSHFLSQKKMRFFNNRHDFCFSNQLDYQTFLGKLSGRSLSTRRFAFALQPRRLSCYGTGLYLVYYQQKIPCASFVATVHYCCAICHVAALKHLV